MTAEKKRPLISIIVPCFNEEEALPVFYKEITRVLLSMSCSYELLFIDDGSKDNTLNELKNFARKDPHVFYDSFSRNFGKEAAMYAGFVNSSGEYAAVMDADMQDPPSLLPKMLEILQNSDYDSVATRRATRSGEPPVRSWFARRFYKLINRISDADIVDGARDFRLMKRKMVDAIAAMGEYNRFSKGIFGWIGFKTYWLSYDNVERVAGQSKWNFWKLFRYAVDGVINFSQAPLKRGFNTGNCHDSDLLPDAHCGHRSKAYVWRSGCGLGIHDLRDYLHWRAADVLSWRDCAVHRKDVSGSEEKAAFHHRGDESG